MRPECNRRRASRARLQTHSGFGRRPGRHGGGPCRRWAHGCGRGSEPAAGRLSHALAKSPRPGSLTVLEADFYTVALDGLFDVVCCWEVFGLGSDADQRRLLRRIAQEWLAPDGCVLVDVYNPIRPAHDAGATERLAPLAGVPGSVEMVERCHFDPVHCRWIDEWEPTAAPEQALAQAIRCYTPAICCCSWKEPGWRCATSKWMARP